MTDKTPCPLIEKIGMQSAETGISFTSSKYGLGKVRVTDQEIIDICLNCPLSICVFSEPNYIQKEARRTRINQAKEMRRAGLSAEQIGVVMGLKKKTIYRYLAYLD